MTYEEFSARFHHVILCIDPDGNILHVVGYPNEPSALDKSALVDELATDEDHGLTKLVFMKDYVMVESPIGYVEEMMREMLE